jgi:hypothetical protein
MPVGKPLHLRLFLEGEEVPVISAQVSINTSAPATASIQVIPLDSALNLLPRTMVHLFFLDTRRDTSSNGKKLDDPTVKGTYRLLFSGEFVGFAWQQTPSSRGLILQCIDFSNYWDSANVMAISYGPGGNAFTNQGSVNGASMGMFTDIPGDSAAEKLVKWLRAPPVTEGLKGISGLAGGVIHIMEAMGGVPGHFKGVNDFYTIAELRCRLLNQITAEENDSTAARVLSVNVFHEWLKNGIEQAGGNVTFRDVMKLLFNYIYYEFVPNPAPKFEQGKAPASSTPYKVPLNQASASAQSEIYSIWSDTLIQFGTVISSAELNTLMDASIKRLTAVIKKLNAIGNATAKAVKILEEVKTGFGKVRVLDATESVSSANITRLGKLDELRIRLLDARTLLTGDTKVSQTNPPGPSSAQRLRTQIVRPDCWFSSPPACNVIFPEMYAQLSYDRNYLQETTRLLVATFNTLVGKDQLLANHILAPFIGFDAEKLSKYKGSKSFRILMDHEIHVGIISKQEWIPNTAGIGQSLDSEQLKKVKDGRLSWLIKASLFHFFKYRFASRQVSVSGRFNPFLVCGFPGAVITRPYIIRGGAAELRANHEGKPIPDSEINTVIHEKADALHAPSHFVGMIGAIQHSVDQSGGTTNAVFHHARKHRGIDDEFLGILAKTNEGRQKRTVKVILDVETAQALASQQNPNRKPLELLVGVTPQKVETQPKPKAGAKPPSVKTTTTSVPVSKASADPSKASGTTSFTSTKNVEQDSNQDQNSAAKTPDRTARGSIPSVNRADILVPMGATKVKVNEKKGLYGGKIVGIEVLDANTVPVSFLVASKTLQYSAVTDDATAEQLKDIPGFTDVHRAAALKKTAKTTLSKAEGVAFSKVAIYEEVDLAVTGSLPIEEILRPSWFSTSYANANIGSKIYMPFFGCGAVVDGLVVAGTQSAGTDASADAEPVDAKTSAGDLMKRLGAQESAKRENSIEKALNVLGYEYGQVKSQGMDVDAFVRDYTNRPIATFQDIFGDSDLKFSITDSAVGGDAKVKQVERNGAKVTPVVGFHTGAVHPDLVGTVENGGKLVGLTTDLQMGFTRVSGVGKEEPLVTLYDVRPAKKAKVTEYLAELGRGPGFQG